MMSRSQTIRVRPAGFISRSIAFISDLVIISLTSTLIIFGLNEILAFFGIKVLLNRWIGNSVDPETINQIIRILVGVITWSYAMLYFAIFWYIIGYTPGKYLVGLKIIRLNGTRLSFWKCILRVLSYYISAILFFMGFFWIIFDQKRQGFHDKIAGTIVIYRQ
jgi:uncharacterized RDD family membrane protein YckC